MSPILDRGKLVVAVDENTEGLASRDSDGQLVGLEIDVARAIASSIFGDGSDDPAAAHDGHDQAEDRVPGTTAMPTSRSAPSR